MNVAVIGGGYAGMAAAVTLAATGVPLTVFEAGKTLGGRARRVDHPELTLDNGLHILIGAYRETLRLMELVGAAPDRHLLRVPFNWEIHSRFSLGAARLPPPLHLLAGLLAARGVTLGERLAAARFVLAMRRAQFTLPQDTSVASLLERERQGAGVVRLLWTPLCVSALNTRPEAASAQVFLNVLRDSFTADRMASDLLLPRVDLSALFPDPARAWVEARGSAVLLGQRVTGIDPGAQGFSVRYGTHAAFFSHVICALPPHQVKAFLIGVSALAELAEAIENLDYQPIYSVYLRYPPSIRLPAPMLGFDSALLQWAFDRGALCGHDGLIGIVISAKGEHEEHAHGELARRVHEELQRQLGPLPPPSWTQVIAEKRATFACTPGLVRPAQQTPLRNLLLAGDYTAGDYPGTLETAVRSGISAANMVIGKA